MALDLSMTRLKTAQFFLSVYESDGETAQSIVGCTLYFHAAGLEIEIDKNSPSDGIEILDTAGGADCAILTIDSDDTEDLPEGGTAEIACELTMVNASDQIFELNRGTLTINANVGEP